MNLLHHGQIIAATLIAITCGTVSTHAGDAISLAGNWRVRLDERNAGVDQRWYADLLAAMPGYPTAIRLPGSTDEHKLGVKNQAKPSLDGLYRLYSYEGRAWYQQEVEIPASWQGKRIQMFLERIHGESSVWIDDRHVGVQDSLIAPHLHKLGSSVSPGKHRLTICIDNTRKIDLGPFVSIRYEGTQTNWNGMVGHLELRAIDQIAVEDVQIYPDVEHRLARVRMLIANAGKSPANGVVSLNAADRKNGRKTAPVEVKFTAAQGQTNISAEIPMGNDVRLWDEFSPALYDLTVNLSAQCENVKSSDSRTISFGMRKFASQGTQFTMNDRPIFLRGTLECAIFPLTGYPPTDTASWQRIYRIIKSHGLNHMRFHSWCPPEAAFEAADREGIMLQVEGPQANVNAGSDPQRDAFIEQEFLRIVRTYGNHPSFCLMTLGNEYGGPDILLTRWIELLKREDPRHLYSSPSCAQTTANRQFTEGLPRGIHGPATTADFRKEIAKEDRPLVAHEVGQWTFYPDFNEIKKYTGVLAARNFELVRDDLTAKHIQDLAPQFVQATGKHATLLYKEEIEVLLRTPGHAGFSLLDLHDYPGQGTALVGPLDPFWDSKGFITPEAYRRYCGPVVPLLRLTKRTFTIDESLEAQAEVANFGPRDLRGIPAQWRIKDEQGHEITARSLPPVDLPTGKLTALGSLTVSLKKAPVPCKLTVSVSLPGTDYSNDWEIWAYSARQPVAAPPGVFVADQWDKAKSLLAEGKKVVFFPKGLNRTQTLPGSFLPVFWSPIWFPSQTPNTMGILCNPKHPALTQFPTEFYSNWQWYELLQNSRSLILDDTPADFRPIVQVIDNFARNHKLGNLFETRVGPGRLLVCTIDLPRLVDRQPAARQLMASLYAYASSNDFQPAGELKLEYLDRLLAFSGCVLHVVRVDSESPPYKGVNAIDGDPNTIWHTPWENTSPSFPHEIQIDLEKPTKLQGIAYLPRQDHANGRIASYEVYLSDDGAQWGAAVAKGKFPNTNAEQKILFEHPRHARYIRLVALSEVNGNRFASIAELDVIIAPNTPH